MKMRSGATQSSRFMLLAVAVAVTLPTRSQCFRTSDPLHLAALSPTKVRISQQYATAFRAKRCKIQLPRCLGEAPLRSPRRQILALPYFASSVALFGSRNSSNMEVSAVKPNHDEGGEKEEEEEEEDKQKLDASLTEAELVDDSPVSDGSSPSKNLVIEVSGVEEVEETSTSETIEAYGEEGDTELGELDPEEKPEVEIDDPEIQVQAMSVKSILTELAAIQQRGPQKFCVLGTRHCSYLHQQIIELLAYALVLSGNHVYTSGAGGTHAAAIRGALRAERQDLLTVVIPQSLSKQTKESQELLQRVTDLITMPQNDHLDLNVASRICNSYLLAQADQLISFAFHESSTVIEASEEAKELDMLVTTLYLD